MTTYLCPICHLIGVEEDMEETQAGYCHAPCVKAAKATVEADAKREEAAKAEASAAKKAPAAKKAAPKAE